MKSTKLFMHVFKAMFTVFFFAGTICAQSNSDSYSNAQKNAKTLKIVGLSSMAAGTGLIIWSLEKYDTKVGDMYKYKEKETFDWQLAAGSFLLGGGILTTVLGFVDGAEAKKMKQSRLVSFQPTAPPARIIGSVRIPQRGVTLKVPIGK